MLSFLYQQFLPIGLAAAAAAGLLLPAAGCYVAALPTQQVAVSIIFVCAGLRLRTDEVWTALWAWRATLWGTFSTLFVTPLVGALIAFQLPLEPSFRVGLALFCCMPTTLSSGIALTAQARGNVALALLLTVLTNFAGILTVPFVLALLLEAVGNVELSAQDLLAKLCLSILLPLVAGKLLRRFLAGWVDRHRDALAVTSNLALISVPWMQFSQSSGRLAQIAGTGIALIVVFGLGIHVVYLLLNDGGARLLRLPPPARTAVVLLASQKTLPVALTVLAFLPIPPETKGLVAIPCVTTHLGQIFFDAVLATRWGHAAARRQPRPVAG
ncbi:MAG: bile acid:sodium symporter [Candidatus Latescibacterota bacterium]